jgi:hypothetical protein
VVNREEMPSAAGFPAGGAAAIPAQQSRGKLLPMTSDAYDRRTELPRILPLWPHELDDESPRGRQLVLAKLRRALRAERRRGIAGHWTYDLARHVELLRVYRLELVRCLPRFNAADRC